MPTIRVKCNVELSGEAKSRCLELCLMEEECPSGQALDGKVRLTITEDKP